MLNSPIAGISLAYECMVIYLFIFNVQEESVKRALHFLDVATPTAILFLGRKKTWRLNCRSFLRTSM